MASSLHYQKALKESVKFGPPDSLQDEYYGKGDA
jgi:hypothetical protein